MSSAEKQLEREARAVEAQIREAFKGVSRAGGVSWSESVADDRYDPHRAEARALDTEQRWEDLVDDPSWDHQPGIGGFNFLDPIGYRYYIAPAMIRCIRKRCGEFVSYALGIDGDFKRGRVSLVDARQAHVIARFVRFMIAVHAAADDEIYGRAWRDAYLGYWKDYDRGTPLE